MENAVKALLIGAAVIIAVLLIGLVMGLFNTGAEQAEGANLDEYQIQKVNDKFARYEGTSVTGSDVNALLTTAFNHNNSQQDTSTCIEVKGIANSTVAKSNAISKAPAKVETGSRYKVSIEYDTKTKLVKTITISKNS